MKTIVYPARRILTMNRNRPRVSHVAVRGGRILGAGSLEELAGWGPYEIDDRFAGKVLMPGLVEGHCHVMEGAFWRFVYLGYFDRMDPEGTLWPGLKSLNAVIGRLRQALNEGNGSETGESTGTPPPALVGWGFDPIYFRGRRCHRSDLDAVAADRIVTVMHASGHIVNVNSRGLEAIGWLRPGVDHPGIPLAQDGLPSGELKGPEAMTPILGLSGLDRGFLGADEDGMRRFGRLCIRTGVTTATDLANPLPDETVATMLRVTGEDDYPARIVALLRLLAEPVPATVARALELRRRGTERLDLGRIKLVVDGSIQGFSARLRPPGYYNGAPNGLWYLAPEQLREALALALQQGVQVHLHTNGDEATDMVLDSLEAVMRGAGGAWDHRFTLQHCQLADDAQFLRIRALGLGVNLFANHLFYWGDEHCTQTVGPERAERMNACASALAAGVPLAIHSDAPITPLAPLFTAWCAVNRRTASGALLGEHQRITVADALHAITLGAAHSLKLDGEIGSIAAGKRADFAVLEEDPTQVDPLALKDLPVWGTVQGGRVFQARGRMFQA